METSDLVQARMFAAVHSLPTRANVTPIPTITDTSLLFNQTESNANLGIRTSIGTSLASNNNHNNAISTSVCNSANGNALMNAFGLTSNLQLPVGLWDNSLFNAALSQYIDANSPLLRCSIQSNVKTDPDHLHNVTMAGNTAGVTHATKTLPSTPLSSVTTYSPTTTSQPALTKNDFSLETTVKKLPVKRTDQRSSALMPLKKLRAAEAQATINKELSFLEQGKAFPCPECHKSFATEVDLKAHLMRHVMQHPFSCPTCGKGFKYEHTLDFHMKSQHGQDATVTPKLNLKSSAKKNAATTVSANNAAKQKAVDHQDEKPKPSVIKSTTKANKQNISNISEMNEFQDLNNNQVLPHKNHAKQDPSPSIGIDLGLSGLTGGVEVKSEKVLIVMLEITNSLNEQTYTLYKCSLCGFSQAKLSLVTEHVQSKHAIQQSPFSCEKCGANFKWQNELLLHDQLHKALDQTNTDDNNAAVNGNAFKNFLIPPLLHSNLLLMNQYLAASANCMNSMPTQSNSASKGASNTLESTSNIQDTSSLLMISSKLKDSVFSKENNGELLNGDSLETSLKHNLRKEQSVLNNSFNVELDSSCNNGHNSVSSSSTSPVSSASSSIGSSLSTSSMIGLNDSTGSGQQPMLDGDYQCLNLTKTSDRKDSESSSQESLNLRKPSKLMMKELRSKEIDELSKNIAVVKENLSNELGEIEETAPGQFKCRFCEKTFDRIFSVHRHERVHTGFKPCVCKVCGRGFSEKRNLRHHIIRFHSDGSGRELLRRVRKDKANSLDSCEARKQLKLMEMNLLALSGSGSGGSFHSNQESDDEEEDEEEDFIQEDTHQMAMICNKSSVSLEYDCEGPSNAVRQRTPYEVRNAALREHEDAEEREKEIVKKEDYKFRSSTTRNASNGSSSRRRKSLPCKKLLAKYRQKSDQDTNCHVEGQEEEDEEEYERRPNEEEDEDNEEENKSLNDMCDNHEERKHFDKRQENEENEQPESLAIQKAY